MHIGEVIKKYRYDHGKMSMQAFADKCGLSKGYIAMLERNKNSKTGDPVVPSVETFIKVAKAMNMTLSELADIVDENQPIALISNELSNKSMLYSTSYADTPLRVAEAPAFYSAKHSAVKIPILGSVVAGLPISAYEDVLGFEEITPEMAAHGEHYALRVTGDSMFPHICEGDIVIVRVQPDVESEDIAVVLVNGDEATLKKVKKDSNGMTLYAYNLAVYEPHVYTNKEIAELPIIISGKVVELRRKL